jgi:hypothetical protein
MIAGTPAEAYLRGRGITCPLPDTLSFIEHYGQDRLPAMLAVFGIPCEPNPGTLSIAADQIAGAHLTFLTPDGSGKTRDRDGRTKIMLGRGHDFPIVLAPAGDGLALGIAEGIEDALSWHQAFGMGGWAAGAAVRLPGVARHIPGFTEHVDILQDDNVAGRNGTATLAGLLAARDIETAIINLAAEFEGAA